MAVTTLSSREFNQDAGGAKKASAKGPVIITDRGRPAHVLLTYEAYQTLLGDGGNLLDAVAQQDGGDFDFDPPRLNGPITREIDLG